MVGNISIKKQKNFSPLSLIHSLSLFALFTLLSHMHTTFPSLTYTHYPPYPNAHVEPGLDDLITRL